LASPVHQQGQAGEDQLKEFYRTSDAYPRDNLASHGEEYFSLYLERVCRFVPQGSHVLDLGCGTGVSSSLLAKRNYRVVGVDISEKFLDRRLEGDCVKLVSADAESLPFPDHSFDAVTSYEFIEHVGNVPAVLEEMARVASPSSAVGARLRGLLVQNVRPADR
jgi:demethylmenaquinone methyltransferase/2-methoxy-6-polyprenyl-1,4-benzoquinol methylase